LIEDGQEVEVGTPLHDGPLDPKLMMKFRGTRETQQYLVEEVQNVYRDQGVSIHDKHIELIVRQMTRRVQIVDAGESPWLPGAMVDVKLFNDTNDDIEASGKEAADGRAQLMGITKASLRDRLVGSRPPPSRRRRGSSPKRLSRASATTWSG